MELLYFNYHPCAIPSFGVITNQVLEIDMITNFQWLKEVGVLIPFFIFL